jgi:uncharacterized protein (TIGR04255 family)
MTGGSTGGRVPRRVRVRLHTMVTSTYSRAPITEAVIELRFPAAIAANVYDKAARRLAAEFPLGEDIQTSTFQIDMSAQKATTQSTFGGKRLSNLDHTRIVLITRQYFASSMLTPYLGWDLFIEGVRQNWSRSKLRADAWPLIRIGLRYLNRIDVPKPSSGGIEMSEYLTIAPKLPLGVPDLTDYILQLSARLDGPIYKLIVNSSTIPSPLVGHLSFVLDIDVFREVDIPNKEADIWSVLEEMRLLKNRIFEGSITDKARDLFNK